MDEYYEIDFLEAGELSSGDAITLRYCKNDIQLTHVVDGGYTDDGQKIVDHINEWYDSLSIDNVVLTHPDSDHANGLKTVLKECDVANLYMNRPWEHVDELLQRFEYNYTRNGLIKRLKNDYPVLAELEQTAIENNVSIQSVFQGNQIGAFTVLAPSKERYIELVVESGKTPEPEREASILGQVYRRLVEIIDYISASWGEEHLKGESDGTSRENEMSIVQYASLCGHKILLTGDAGIETLEEAYEYAPFIELSLPGIDRFQVPHHGSRRNLSSNILDKWLGQKLEEQSENHEFTAIVSANQNDKAHPKKAVVRALIHRNTRVFQTKGVFYTYHNPPKDRGWSSATPLDYPNDTEEM